MTQTNEKLLSMIGMSRRAGKVIYGFDATIASFEKRELFAIFLAKDVSVKTKKEVHFRISDETFPVIELPVTKSSLSQMLGKELSVFGIKDEGLASRVKELAKEAMRRDLNV